RDRGQVIDQNRPGREWPYRRHGLEVALACVADLDLARLLTPLGRQIAELVVVRLAAVDAAQLGNRPSRAAAAAAQLALALPGRASVQRYPSMEQEGSLEGSLRCAPGRDGLPGGAVLALTQRRLEQPEPRCRLGCLLAGFGDALLKLYVPRSPKTAVGPEHFTFTVRQGVRD